MKNFVLIATLLFAFASGYLIASQLAASSPRVLEVAAQNTQPACENNSTADITSAEPAMQRSLQFRPQPASQNKVQQAEQYSIVERSQPEISLSAYSSQVASELPAVTELILQLEQSEFSQLLENHQQHQGGEMAAMDYQQQLADFFAAQPALSLQQLDCRADLCLLQLELQDESKWPQIFGELSSQPWWQSVSYQAPSADSADGYRAATRSRQLILQQQQMGVLQDFNQTQMLADDGASQ
ncbi:hypothetical protein [Rheinheimera sp. 4Y26]|uniref:hypothetical protein n=1 Tax=Rheinheimera sp. 4Y26 TaxID=2977811 RepID=UPI0021B121D5|nr:hypothetical protein [Rheinheimera sp. 4Y26]MCT6700284.1 hypothetical protein [Rheinheimera sp. 4Y26]